MMDPFKMVVLIVMIVCIAGVLKAYLERGGSKEDIARMLGLDEAWGDDLTGVGSHMRKIEELEERVRVLERIVTSSKHDLRREIDDLARG